jgi:hypothetical protein
MASPFTGTQKFQIRDLQDPVIGEVTDVNYPDDETGETELIIKTDDGVAYVNLADIIIWSRAA